MSQIDAWFYLPTLITSAWMSDENKKSRFLSTDVSMNWLENFKQLERHVSWASIILISMYFLTSSDSSSSLCWIKYFFSSLLISRSLSGINWLRHCLTQFETTRSITNSTVLWSDLGCDRKNASSISLDFSFIWPRLVCMSPLFIFILDPSPIWSELFIVAHTGSSTNKSDGSKKSTFTFLKVTCSFWSRSLDGRTSQSWINLRNIKSLAW